MSARATWASLSGCRGALALLVLLYGISAMRQVELPGLYMDAINPDFLVAQTLDGRIHNPVWRMPGPPTPILGGIYYGAQTYYLGLGVFSVLGESVVSARIAHALIGLSIVLLLYLLVRRATSSPALALFAGAGLATDIAFVASFRSQNYIVLGGETWLLASLLLLLDGAGGRRGRWTLLASGVCMGLAAYGYFVHLFFAPVLLALALFWRESDSLRTRMALWGGGFIIGMLPYVLGYGLALIATGGPGPFMAWLRGTLVQLHPLGDSAGYFEGLAVSLHNARLALQGSGNDLMLLGESLVPDGVHAWPVVIVLASLVCIVGLARKWRDGLHGQQGYKWLALLPVCYLLVAGIFGARLWVHHFSVLVALAYLTLALAVHQLLGSAPGNETHKRRLASGAVVVVLGILVLSANVVQQNRFFARLEQTGGVGMATSASAALAESALAERDRAVYLFPEWGFFMPFAFLTGNRVHYELAASERVLAAHRGLRDEVRLAFWNGKDADRYRRTLSQLGAQDLKLYTFTRRDGKPAFFLWGGRLARR